MVPTPHPLEGFISNGERCGGMVFGIGQVSTGELTKQIENGFSGGEILKSLSVGFPGWDFSKMWGKYSCT